ncbi:MAG: hypothetical protein ABIP55_05350 [Tepidisphaeraceae bacterium]
MLNRLLIAALVLASAASFLRGGEGLADAKICGVYTSVIEFASRDARQAVIDAQPSFLMDKHKRAMAGDNAGALKLVREAGFDTLFMTIYPLWGKDWWAIPAARNLVKDALVQSKGRARVHLGLSLFNAHMCQDPSRYPGASRTIQCDGTRPSWVCFFDDELWRYYAKNVVEMAKLGGEVPGVLGGIFIDPETYGPECYLCFCDNCIRKFNAWSGAAMPAGLVKPDAWLHANQLWTKYTVDWHGQEVLRHAIALREAIHAIDPKLRLSSLLWDYPVAVGAGDPRQQYFRMLAIGLGTKEMPAWTLPEHTYYSDAADLERLIGQIERDIVQLGGEDRVRVLPGIRILRRDAASLPPRGQVVRDSSAVGYWMYELSDLGSKTPVDFEGTLVDPREKYVESLAQMNRIIRAERDSRDAGAAPPGR